MLRLNLMIAALLCCAAASAQDDSAQQLPDVMVTSDKIERTLEQVPASVSSVDGEFLRRSGIYNFEQVQDYVPNVSLAMNHTAGVFAIRGLATPDTNPGFDPSVGVVVDGVYYARTQFLTAFFFDIDRVEVLRGPQGALFGKNSTAGVLNLVTARAQNEWLAAVETKGTSFGDRSIVPVIQLPLLDVLSLRLSGKISRGDEGVLYNTFLQRGENNPQSESARARMSYVPDGPVTLDLEAFYSRERFNNNAFQFSRLTPKMRDLLESYDPQIDSELDRNNSQNFPSKSDGAIRGANGTFTFDVGGQFGIPNLIVTTIISAAESITDKKDLDADFSPVPFIDNQLIGDNGYSQVTDEVRLTGEGETVFGFGHGYNFITGAFLSSSHFRTHSFYEVEDLGGAFAYCNATEDFCGLGFASPAPGGAGGDVGQVISPALAALFSSGSGEQNAQITLDQKGRSYALFGQFEFFFTRQWALIGGLRYGNERKKGFATSQSDSQLIKAITEQDDHRTARALKEVDYSPKAGLKFEVNPRTSAYLTFARGYKSGGFNALPLSNRNLTYEPEEATSVELGSKAVIENFPGGPMRLSAALFHTRFSNLQVSTFTGGSFVVLNAATAISRGIDFDMHWLTPLQGLSLTSAVGYSDARYRSYTNAPAISGSDSDTQDISGERLSFAPRVTASLIPAYSLPTQYFAATLAVDILYRGDRYLDVDLDPNKLQPATTIYNTRVSLESPTRRWGFNLVAHNLTEEVFANQAISQPLAPGGVLVYRTDYGRYISGNISVQF